jgi:haloalkane dehalogenase
MLCAAMTGLIAGAAMAEEVRPGIYRTPNERFENLPGYDFTPHYKNIQGYRIHYLDEGPADGEPILLLHGEPTWSYLYRKMIPVLTAAGHRCIVPDLIGFGRSDKPASMDVHTYKFHVDTITELVKALNLRDATFFGQDWGSLIGLRVVAENEARFARVVIANAGLPVGRLAGPEAIPEGHPFMQWRRMNQAMIDRGDIPTGAMVSRVVGDPSIAAAYDAPFPDPSYKAGPLIMPQRVPVFTNDPANEANRKAWEVFRRWEKPFLTAFSDGDPITRGGEVVFQRSVPGAKNQPHTTIKGAGHFLQEQAGEELARVIVKFIADNPLRKATAMVTADDIPVAHTPKGYWKTMPVPILAGCNEPQ